MCVLQLFGMGLVWDFLVWYPSSSTGGRRIKVQTLGYKLCVCFKRSDHEMF